MAHSKLYVKIMNSNRWREVRAAQMLREPYCEECKKEGFFTPVQCVHHRIEIENAKTEREAYELAYAASNLVSLCFDCHNAIHTRRRSHSKEAHKARENTRLQQWIDSLNNNNKNINNYEEERNED